MKCLKVESGQGHYSTDGENWSVVDKINKEELLQILNNGLDSGFEMDEFSTEQIKNKAHQIIYRNLYEKLGELNRSRTRFKDESESFYKEAFDKYSE